jgi:hypothetical protein
MELISTKNKSRDMCSVHGSGSDLMTTRGVIWSRNISLQTASQSILPQVLTTHWFQRFELIASRCYALRGGLHRGALIPDYPIPTRTIFLGCQLSSNSSLGIEAPPTQDHLLVQPHTLPLASATHIFQPTAPAPWWSGSTRTEGSDIQDRLRFGC